MVRAGNKRFVGDVKESFGGDNVSRRKYEGRGRKKGRSGGYRKGSGPVECETEDFEP